MTTQPPTGDTFNMTGDFRGAILNIKSTLTGVSQTISALPDAEPSLKQELQQLIAQLQAALDGTPPDKAQDAAAVAEMAASLVQKATEAQPNKTMLHITGQGLKQAAQNIADVMPTVLTIATQIVTAVGKLVP
jgi:hypothetical protein